MLIVKVRESGSVQNRLLNLIDRDCYKIVKLCSPQTEGNKDCEVHRRVDFLHVHSGPSSWIIELEVDKIGHMCGLKICWSKKT